jgi:hypothetical protein
MLAHGHNDQPSHSQSRPQTDKLYSSSQHKAPDLLDIADPGHGKFIDDILQLFRLLYNKGILIIFCFICLPGNDKIRNSNSISWM